jgi:protein-tyrosine sulfotransferase
MSLGVGLLDYRHRWRIMRRLQEIQPSTVAPIVIGGCGSSGTTLLRHVLDRHPSIFCGPESTVFLERISRARDLARRFGFTEREILEWQRASRTQVEFIERFRTLCLVRSGKSVWADKTPENVRRFDVIRCWFPQARFIHVIRDGRDVVCSLRQAQWMKLEKITGGADRSSPEAVEACIRYWIERVTVGRRLRRDPRYLEVRYEDLVEHTESVLRRILAFLNVDWDSRVLAHDPSSAEPAAGPVYESAVGRWHTDLSSGEAEIVKRYAGLLWTSAMRPIWAGPRHLTLNHMQSLARGQGLPKLVQGPNSASVAALPRFPPWPDARAMTQVSGRAARGRRFAGSRAGCRSPGRRARDRLSPRRCRRSPGRVGPS